MTISLEITSAIIGLSIAATIFTLIRHDHLQTHHLGWWLANALFIALLGLFPSGIDKVAYYFDIKYPPTLLLIIAIGMILIKVLRMDIHQSHQERKIRRLVQRLALLEEKLDRTVQEKS